MLLYVDQNYQEAIPWLAEWIICPLKFVSRFRDPKLQVRGNLSIFI